MKRVVTAQAISREAFAPYGDVVSAGLSAGSAANQGTATRFDGAARLSSTRPAARPNLAVYRSVARTLPLSLHLLERHPCSTQVFLPMLCSRILVCVAGTAPDGEPDLDTLRAFLCEPGQGVAYGVGVWHHPIVALDAPAELAMLAWEDGTALDCEERPLTDPVLVIA